MPRKYNQTVIYKIACKDPSITDIYVGVTTDFCRCKSKHNRTSKYENLKGYTDPFYTFIRENGGFDNFEMVPIELHCVNSKIEQDILINQYIENLKPRFK